MEGIDKSNEIRFNDNLKIRKSTIRSVPFGLSDELTGEELEKILEAGYKHNLGLDIPD